MVFVVAAILRFCLSISCINLNLVAVSSVYNSVTAL